MSFSNFTTIGPITDVQIFPWVAGQTGPPVADTSKSVGPGMEEFKLTTKAGKVEYTKAAALLHARVGTFISDMESDVTMKGDQITNANIAKVTGSTATHTGKDVVHQGTGGVTSDFTIWAVGWNADGIPKGIWIPRCSIVPDSELAPDWKQIFLPWTISVLCDPTATYTDPDTSTVYGNLTWVEVDNPAVAPATLLCSAVSPADGATGQSTSVVPLLTFSAALDGLYVNTTNFFLVRQDTKAEVAATVAFQDAARKIVKITPNSALAGGTKTYQIVVVPNAVRDTNGNIFAGQVTTFVTT